MTSLEPRFYPSPDAKYVNYDRARIWCIGLALIVMGSFTFYSGVNSDVSYVAARTRSYYVAQKQKILLIKTKTTARFW